MLVDFTQDLPLILAYLSPFQTNFSFNKTVPLLGIFVFGIFYCFSVKLGKSGRFEKSAWNLFRFRFQHGRRTHRNCFGDETGIS